MAALFESAIDTHEHRLSVGAARAPVGVTVFADDHRRPDGALGQIVVEGNPRLVEKRKQVVPMTAKTLEQPPRLAVLPSSLDQLVQPLVQPLATRREGLGGQPFLSPQTNGLPQQATQLFGERRPVSWPKSAAQRRPIPLPADRSPGPVPRSATPREPRFAPPNRPHPCSSNRPPCSSKQYTNRQRGTVLCKNDFMRLKCYGNSK